MGSVIRQNPIQSKSATQTIPAHVHFRKIFRQSLIHRLNKMLRPDEFYMSEALRLAHIAYQEGEVPVGAVVVADGRIIGKGYNQVERLQDPTAHAEMLAISSACNALNARYLQGCSLYVSLEPCPMCAGAISWAQLERIVFAASDIKRGFQVHSPSLLPPRTIISGGILANEASDLLKQFFKEIRKQ